MNVVYAVPKETHEGQLAFHRGWNEAACPYPIRRHTTNDGRRQKWFDGFYHEQIGHKLREVFERHGVTW